MSTVRRKRRALGGIGRQAIEYGYRPLDRSECERVIRARERIDSIMRDLDGLPVEPVRDRTLYADLEAVDFRLSEVVRQLCKKR